MDQPGLSPPALLRWNHGVRKCNESAQLKQGEHIPNGELWLEKSHPLDKVIKYASVLWKRALQISDTTAAQSRVLHLKGACFCRRCVLFFSTSGQLLKAGFHEKSHSWWFSVNYKVKAVGSWWKSQRKCFPLVHLHASIGLLWIIVVLFWVVF